MGPKDDNNCLKGDRLLGELKSVMLGLVFIVWPLAEGKGKDEKGEMAGLVIAKRLGAHEAAIDAISLEGSPEIIDVAKDWASSSVDNSIAAKISADVSSGSRGLGIGV